MFDWTRNPITTGYFTALEKLNNWYYMVDVPFHMRQVKFIVGVGYDACNLNICQLLFAHIVGCCKTLKQSDCSGK